MDTFIAIDFETADAKRDSACAIGMVRVEFGEIVAREVRLIRPPRGVDQQNVRVHGLSFGMLKNKPLFPAVWAELLPALDGADRLVAHFAQFDRSVLKACCTAAGVKPPELPWTCTCEMAQKRWPDDGSHKLPDVCRRNGVPVGRHHSAGDDAEMCARCLLAMEGLGSADKVVRAMKVAAIFKRAAETGRRV